MEPSRRSFLLGSVSFFALVAAGGPLARSGTILPAPLIPDALYEPGTEAMAAAVRGVVSLMNRPGLIGLDFCDIDAVVLSGGGRGVCGVGEAAGPNRARLAAERAVQDVRRIHG